MQQQWIMYNQNISMTINSVTHVDALWHAGRGWRLNIPLKKRSRSLWAIFPFVTTVSITCNQYECTFTYRDVRYFSLDCFKLVCWLFCILWKRSHYYLKSVPNVQVLLQYQHLNLPIAVYKEAPHCWTPCIHLIYLYFYYREFIYYTTVFSKSSAADLLYVVCRKKGLQWYSYIGISVNH